jgi:hypothetical protein
VIVANALLAAEMGSAGALQSAASPAGCSTKRRMCFFVRQSPEFASFFLNSSQGKALFTHLGGALHNFRRYRPAGSRMPVFTGRSPSIRRCRKSAERSMHTSMDRVSFGRSGFCPLTEKKDDGLGLLRDIQQERVAAPRMPASALWIWARRHGRRIGPSFALRKKENSRAGRIRLL